MPLHLSHLHRPAALVLLAAALGAVALTWTRVVQTISEAKPVPVRGHATAVVWGDRVFGSRVELARWLRSRGTSYDGWSKKHPVAGAVIEHRRVKPARRPHPAPRPVHKAAAAEQTRLAAARPSGDSLLRRLLVAMLVLLAAACAWAAALPAVFRHRFPSLAWTVGRYRELFLTGAVALVVGLVIGVALN